MGRELSPQMASNGSVVSILLLSIFYGLIRIKSWNVFADDVIINVMLVL